LHNGQGEEIVWLDRIGGTLPVLEQTVLAPQIDLVRASFGFGSSSISEQEQIERQDEWANDMYRSYISKYWRDVLLKPTFDKAEKKLEDMTKIGPNWDSYDAEPPNQEARANAAEVLILLQEQALAPSTIVPSAEGGVAICFVRTGTYADIECLNTGEILAVTYAGNNEPDVWDVDQNSEAVRHAIDRIKSHFAR
jgi:hypothetical protein